MNMASNWGADDTCAWWQESQNTVSVVNATEL